MKLPVRRTRSVHAARGRTGLVAVAGLLASLVPVLAVAGAPGASAAEEDASPWTPVAGVLRASGDQRLAQDPTDYAAFTLDDEAMLADLAVARGEGRRAVPAEITLPDPEGKLITFTVTESSLYQPGLAAQYPDFKQYIGVSKTGGDSLALDVSPYGLHASVRGDGTSFLVDPAYISDTGTYMSYRAASLPERQQQLVEPELDRATRAEILEAGQKFGEAPDGVVNLRTYRLAFLTDPTYAEYVAPGSNAGTISETESNRQVLAAKTVLMDRVNQIYSYDLAIKMVLVDGTDKMNFNTTAEMSGANGPCGSSACFTTSQTANACNDTSTLTRNRYVVGQLIGASNFDIGHIGFGLNGGGVASLGVVGGLGKAQGCTGLPQPIGDFYAVDYVAHEMGHQFSGNHTFNGTQVNCSTSNRTGTTGVEPGSGSSVMAYAGICSSDDLQPHTDPYFSQRSQTEISNYLSSTLANANEVQEFGLTSFTTNGNAFTLTFPSFTNALGVQVAGGTTAPIVRGTNYTAAGIKAAIEAVTGATVTATGMFATGAPGDTGFTITYSGNLAGVDVPTPTLTVTSQTAPITVVGNDVVKGGPATNNGTLSTFGNHAPSVSVPAPKFLPTRTPFTLTGSASDLDDDQLVYLWEQNDNGASGTTTGVGLTQQPKANGPLFRVFGHYANVVGTDTLLSPSPGENVATSEPSRTFPDMSQVLAGATNQATGSCPVPTAADTKSGVAGSALKDGPVLECFSEFLPTSAYVGTPAAANVEPSLNFRLTARDQNPFGGGYQFADLKLRLDRNAGPLYVTSFATSGQVLAGDSEQTVTWDVNNTDKASLAPHVRISLSTDGGATFPTVLADATPNDGSQVVRLPNVNATAARIKVEAVDNYFFDVNHADVAIDASFVVDSSIGDQVVQYSDAPTGAVAVTSGTGDSSTVTATASGLPDGLVLTRTSASAPGVVPGTATFAVTGSLEQSTGTSTPVLTFSDGAESQTVEPELTAAPEDASVTYTGPLAVQEPTSGPTAAALTLTAQVAQVDDGTPGDLTTATATFTDTTADEVLCSVPVPANGAVSCDYAGDLPSAGRTMTVEVSIGGNYTGVTSTDTPVVLSVGPADPGLVLVGPDDATPVAQYGDVVPAGTARITATSGTVPSEDFAISVVGLPAGLTYAATSASDPGVLPGQVTYGLGGTAAVGVGSYPVTVTVDDGTHAARSFGLTLTVTPEGATATYTGPGTATAATGGPAALAVPLTAAVVQAADGSSGDLTTGSASFVDVATGDVLCVDPAIGADGTAACTLRADLPAGDAGRTYDVRVDVGRNFVGASAPSRLVVSVDPTVPDTFIASGPADGSILLASTATFSASSSKPGATFACRLDGATVACPDGTVTLRLTQKTHVFSVTATDRAGHQDASPAISTFTVPVDDRRLKRVSDEWVRGKKRSSAYRSTLTTTRSAQQTLSSRVRGVTAISLVAPTGPKFGRVKVMLGDTLLKKVSLRGPRQARQVLEVADFPAATSGRLRIVTLSDTSVQIDGLVLVTRP